MVERRVKKCSESWIPTSHYGESRDGILNLKEQKVFNIIFRVSKVANEVLNTELF